MKPPLSKARIGEVAGRVFERARGLRFRQSDVPRVLCGGALPEGGKRGVARTVRAAGRQHQSKCSGNCSWNPSQNSPPIEKKRSAQIAPFLISIHSLCRRKDCLKTPNGDLHSCYFCALCIVRRVLPPPSADQLRGKIGVHRGREQQQDDSLRSIHTPNNE